MAKKQRPDGVCHICGTHGLLSFEHVPPEKAFNDRPALLLAWESVLALSPDEQPRERGIMQQRGIGGYTLCDPCNNNTGSWYGDAFVEWCYQGAMLLERSNGNPSLLYPYYIFPLRILKQIVSMFFSVNPDRFRTVNEALVRFVLNKEARYLPPKYRFFVYYNIEGRPRLLPFGAKMDVFEGRSTIMSEITYPPFGYVMTINSGPSDRRIMEITHFARYEYNDFLVMSLKLTVLPTHVVIHGDYRSKEQIYREAAESARYLPSAQS